MGRLPWIICPQEAGRRVRVREEEGTMRQRSESCEVGTTSRGRQGASRSQKRRGGFSPRASRETWLCWHLSFRTSDSQNCQRTNLWWVIKFETVCYRSNRKVIYHPLTLPITNTSHQSAQVTELSTSTPCRFQVLKCGSHLARRLWVASAHVTGTTFLPDASWSLSFGLRDLHLQFLVSKTYQRIATDQNNNSSFTGLLWESNKQSCKAPSPVPGTVINVQ